MELADFSFDLPEDLIALRPARPRSSARLMVVERGARREARVADLPAILRPGDHLVLNDTRVIPARLSGTRTRGDATARIEVTLIAPTPDGWRALAKPAKKLAEGETIDFGDLAATVAAREGGEIRLVFDLRGNALDEAIEARGTMPLPPYIAGRRAPDEADREDYQTVWARRPGAVAAPTASLHFDAPLLEALAAAGVGSSHVTLHVGAGTFLPVTAERIEEHRMHAERGEIGVETVDAINAARARGGRIIPVGTTALRVLETAAANGALRPWAGETDLFIRPGHRFRATDGLITNFHLPGSTLIMLVAALIGLDTLRETYAAAIRSRFRFYSYGDASLLIP